MRRSLLPGRGPWCHLRGVHECGHLGLSNETDWMEQCHLRLGSDDFCEISSCLGGLTAALSGSSPPTFTSTLAGPA